MWHFKWIYGGKDRQWVGLIWKFKKKYIIMPTESYYYSFPEESRYIAIRSPQGFINQ